MARKREAFLNDLLGYLRPKLEQKKIAVMGPDIQVEWPGQPGNLWPRADAVLTEGASGLRFIVEDDEDSDPGRSLVKYWPYLDKYGSGSFVYIGVWKRGQTYGEGFFKLAEFIAQKLVQFYPSFRCHLIRRSTETAAQVAEEIRKIVDDRLSSQLK